MTDGGEGRIQLMNDLKLSLVLNLVSRSTLLNLLTSILNIATFFGSEANCASKIFLMSAYKEAKSCWLAIDLIGTVTACKNSNSMLTCLSNKRLIVFAFSSTNFLNCTRISAKTSGGISRTIGSAQCSEIYSTN